LHKIREYMNIIKNSYRKLKQNIEAKQRQIEKEGLKTDREHPSPHKQS